MMIPPSKELLIFYNQIDEWVDQVYPDQDKPSLLFKKALPNLFQIYLIVLNKSKIGFVYQEHKYSNNNYG